MNSKKDSNKKKPIGDFFYNFVKVTAAIPTLIFVRPKVIYMDKKQKLKGGFIASANHCSFLDPVMVHCIYPFRTIHSLATQELFSSPLKIWFFEHVHCIPVDKENFNINSFHEVTKQLKRGRVVSIFPEGGISVKSAEVKAFKTGMILMAHRAKAPIVPIYLCPQEHLYHRRIAVVGNPIDVRQLCGDFPSAEAINQAAEYIHQKEMELKEKIK